MDDIFSSQMQSIGIQVLESSYIIASSKNIDTIISRYEFLLVRTATLKQEQNNPAYSSCAQLVTDRYKELYYDRPLQDYQLSILSNPTGFDIGGFYCNSIVNAMKRFCGEQIEDINGMKKENAKIKRSAKVLETISKTKTELQTKCSAVTSYSTALNELNNLETTFNKPV